MTLKGLIEKDIPAPSHLFLKLHTMLTNLKKLVALSGAVALVAMNLVPAGVGAAAINVATASDGAAAGILITGVGAGTSATVRVEKDGVVVATATGGTVASGVLTIADPDGTANSLVDNGYYVITFNTNIGDFGSATLDKNGGNKVNVTATVVPTLSLTLTGSAVTFGVLTPGTVTPGSANPVLTVKTNATLGYTLKVASATGALASGSDRINSVGGDLDAAADGYGLQATGSGGAIAGGYAGGSDIVGAVTISAANLMTGTRTAGDVATLTLKAKASNTTAAGNYSDTLTFTLAGTF